VETALKAIAEPRRLEILKLIWNQELSAGEIAQQFTVTRPAISQHLKVLEVAGLVRVRKMGVRRFYRARPDKLAELRRYLEEFWTTGLERLAAAAEAEERRLRAHDDPAR